MMEHQTLGGEEALEPTWIPIDPHLIDHAHARTALRRAARRLMCVGSNGTVAQTIGVIRDEETILAVEQASAVAPDLVLCVNVLCDLRAQGWLLRVDRHGIAALPPLLEGDTVRGDKERIRTAHLVERDAQLRQPAVRRFIRGMERRKPHRGEWHSIFSLIRDGRDLARELQAADRFSDSERTRALRTAIDPYVQTVAPGAVCEFTGFALSDIWRYFRHTWATTYQSTPGRKVYYLIRDRATPFHAVIGIGALGSSIVQLSVRDEWIGWTGPRLVAEIRKAPTAGWARWLARSLRQLIKGVLVDDFLAEGEIRSRDLDHPTPEVIARLTEIAVAERKIHRLYPARGLHKKVSATSRSVDWREQAQTHLFRSKRASALAELLEARRKLQAAGFARATLADLRKALADPDAVRAIHAVLRRTKAAHVGVDMMDITVCGAIAPYNRILGGKLVSLLMASPAVTESYNERYRSASSVIASSMAGRAIRRHPRLVLLGTTSLYGVGASQYNRLHVPAEAISVVGGNELRYFLLGKTAGYGSYHFSRETMAAIDPVLRRLQRGRPVNSIFGEGVNPKLRKVRSALDAVGLSSDELLQHGNPRLIYAVPLAVNFRDVLIGRSRRPQYVLSGGDEATAHLVDYWCDRWLSKRIRNVEVLHDIAGQSLAYPIQHDARVALPESVGESGPLFADGLGVSS